ncbi:MAG: L-rhamnose/proton symporter RhaT [Patescibacteria group bacterium]
MLANMALGVLLSAVAGLGTGSSFWPMKVIRKLHFEHYWFIGMLPLLIIPWAVMLLSVNNLSAVFSEIGWRPLIISNLFAISWGVANVLAGICTARIGFTLTGAILTGVSTIITVTIPMILKGSGIFNGSPGLASVPGLMILSGVAITLFGVILSAKAGFGREKIQAVNNTVRPSSGSFLVGLVLVIIAGVLAIGQAFAFVYSQDPIITAMRNHGAGGTSANFGFWAIGLLGGILVNILYPALLMFKNKSWGVLKQSPRELLLSTLIGSQLIVAFSIQGIGMIALGALGASVGTGIKQAMQFISGQGVGFISGEWKGISGKPINQMITAGVLLVLAVVLMVFARIA